MSNRDDATGCLSSSPRRGILVSMIAFFPFLILLFFSDRWLLALSTSNASTKQTTVKFNKTATAIHDMTHRIENHPIEEEEAISSSSRNNTPSSTLGDNKTADMAPLPILDGNQGQNKTPLLEIPSELRLENATSSSNRNSTPSSTLGDSKTENIAPSPILDGHPIQNKTSPLMETPTGLRLAFIGDSVTRFQYLSLAHYLHNGKWEDPKSRPSIVVKTHHGNWQDFLNSSAKMLAPNERCDCYRSADGRNFTVQIENRYYYDPIRDNMIVYISKYGTAIDARGHLLPEEILEGPFFAFPQTGPLLWEYTHWGDILRRHLAKLSVKPKYVMINQGLWNNSLVNETAQVEIATALRDLGMVGIYRTTTKNGFPPRPVEVFPYELDMCAKLDMCLNVSWTYELNSRSYLSDRTHFREPIYTRMNKQLLEMIGVFEDGHATVGGRSISKGGEKPITVRS